MTPEVQLELVKLAQQGLPMVMTFVIGLFMPQPQAKKDKPDAGR